MLGVLCSQSSGSPCIVSNPFFGGLGGGATGSRAADGHLHRFDAIELTRKTFLVVLVGGRGEGARDGFSTQCTFVQWAQAIHACLKLETRGPGCFECRQRGRWI